MFQITLLFVPKDYGIGFLQFPFLGNMPANGSFNFYIFSLFSIAYADNAFETSSKTDNVTHICEGL
jgi:hypothetical protein